MLHSPLALMTLLATVACTSSHAQARQNQGTPETGSGDPDAQDGANNDKPPGTGEETDGDPVEISTGAFCFSKQVLELPGRGRNLSLTLSYVSNAQGIETQTGARWTHDLEERLMLKYTWGTPPEPYPGPQVPPQPWEPAESELAPLRIDVYHAHDLRIDLYQRDPNDQTNWLPTSGQFTKLRSENITSGPYSIPRSFLLRHPDGTVVSFPNALWEGGCGNYTIRAATITDRQGNVVTLNYESMPKPGWCPGNEGTFYRRLESAIDTLGRQVSFDYDAVGWLSTITDFTGRVVTIDHDAIGNVIAITTPQVSVFPPDTTMSPYSSRTEIEYVTPNPSYPHTKHNVARVFAPTEVAAGLSQPSERKPYVENFWDTPGERVQHQALGGTNLSGIPAGGTHAFLYEVFPSGNFTWFTAARRTLSVDPDGRAELHYFDASWRPRLVYRFTGRLDPALVASQNHAIGDLVQVNASSPSASDQLNPSSSLPPSGSVSSNEYCQWTKYESYTTSNLPLLEVTQDSRTDPSSTLVRTARARIGLGGGVTRDPVRFALEM